MIHLGQFAALPAAFLGFLIGGLWYGPVFGKAWAAARGLGDQIKQGANMVLIFGLTFVLNLVSAEALLHVLDHVGADSLHMILMISGGIALGFIIPSMGVNYLFSRMSLRLFLIDAGYWLVIYVVMGVVLAYIR